MQRACVRPASLGSCYSSGKKREKKTDKKNLLDYLCHSLNNPSYCQGGFYSSECHIESLVMPVESLLLLRPGRKHFTQGALSLAVGKN